MFTVFFVQSDLSHMKLSHAEKNIKCSHCDKMFVNGKLYPKHTEKR